MEQKICQSCGMPLTEEAVFATHSDGSRNEDYCIYCYRDGSFTSECTMEQMIEHCSQFVGEFNRDSAEPYTKEQAVAEMRRYFPTLKRWRKP